LVTVQAAEFAVIFAGECGLRCLYGLEAERLRIMPNLLNVILGLTVLVLVTERFLANTPARA
jgi:hypothetical protein